MQAQSKIGFSDFSTGTMYAAISGTWKIGSEFLVTGEVFKRLTKDHRYQKNTYTGTGARPGYVAMVAAQSPVLAAFSR